MPCEQQNLVGIFAVDPVEQLADALGPVERDARGLAATYEPHLVGRDGPDPAEPGGRQLAELCELDLAEHVLLFAVALCGQNLAGLFLRRFCVQSPVATDELFPVEFAAPVLAETVALVLAENVLPAAGPDALDQVESPDLIETDASQFQSDV